MSPAWLEAARETGTKIVGLVDIDRERARQRAEEFGIADAVVGSDLDAVLAETRPDVVFDIVVPSARREVVLTALRHGCHVLTEKPLAATAEDARAIVAAARDAGRVHAVIQNRRFLAEPRRIRRFLGSGAIGTPTSIHCDFFLAPHFGGFREEMRHVLLLDMAIHTFDSARYLVGGTPSDVYCREWDPAGSWYLQGSSAVAVFDMQDGAVFTYRGSWCADGLAHQLGECLAHRRRAGEPDVGRPCGHPGRGPHRRFAKGSSTAQSRSSAAARSARPRGRSSRA